MAQLDPASLIFVTGGHTTPAIACIEELRARGYNNLMFIGQKKSLLFDKNPSAEYRLVTEQLKLPFLSIIAGKLSLFRNVEAIIWLLRFPIGFIQALYWQLRYRPKAVLTFGSHIGIPPAFWGKVFNIPVVAHEQTVTIGRAQAVIQRFASAICYSWESSDHRDSRFQLTGNPIRKAILEPAQGHYQFADPSKPTLLVTGGNQGAHALNQKIFDDIEVITERYNVIHQTGSNTLFNDIVKARELAEKVNKSGVRYDPRAYLNASEMSEAYALSAVILSRAGANTVTELLALRKAALLVPIPTTSGNEQFLNGKLLEELGLGVVVSQRELEQSSIVPRLEQVATLQIKDEARVRSLSQLHLDAEKRVVDILIGA